MRWISSGGRANNAAPMCNFMGERAVSTQRLLVSLVLWGTIFLSGAGSEKHLSVYSVAANYSLPLVERNGRDYIGLLELLEPLGAVNARSDGLHWRLRYNNLQAEFTEGKTKVHIQGRDADLSSPFVMENGRGFIPVTSLSVILPRFLGGPVSLHEDMGRLFVGNVATHFTASLSSENPPRLVFNFTSPVNPTVSTEAGVLRMTFRRDPVVAPASSTLTFGSKTIPSATYSEGDGAAVIAVNATTPIMASFSNDGRTVTISAGPQNTAQKGSQPAASPAPSAPVNPMGGSSNPPSRRYFAIVDASHGGDDHGEALSAFLKEKDVTLSLARSLRQELESRGVTTLLLREGDAGLTVDQRAGLANAAHAAVYVALHASSTGHGVRIYTALLPYEDSGNDDRGPFRAWATSQHFYLPLSQMAANSVATEMQRRQIPVRTVPAPLRPLNNITAAAVAVEIAPQGSDVAQLAAPDYEQLVTSAVATAIATARDRLGSAQ
ncbi:MAG TPA: N-acetylmuramoyl-L-alanine amidase [Candidatus Sulfotelmatobacter sp.]